MSFLFIDPDLLPQEQQLEITDKESLDSEIGIINGEIRAIRRVIE